ncbi:YbaN family protein [Sphingomonas sp.]|uniref:YbaN family protein n=1 Tax=Sphingomonas sp. TaxID=28214 RepID=UPI00179AA898|nr:YbaN family protein [Sphingomonas sp.]MBA4761980.1 YbaN family protein [Sphingomonas sp.]
MRRHLYLIAGFLCLGLAVLGAVLPVMPTTVFVIMAAYCFARSSPALERRLLEHPRFGPHIVRWRDNGAVSRSGKIAASIAFTISIALTLALTAMPWPLVPIGAAVVIGGWLWTRPEA